MGRVLALANVAFTPEADIPQRNRYVRFGSKADICNANVMSALPLKADIAVQLAHVRFVPIADMATLFELRLPLEDDATTRVLAIVE